MKGVVKQLAGVLVAFLMVLSSPVRAEGWDQAQALIEETTRKMMVLLEDSSLRQESGFERLYAGVDSVLEPVVDFERVARGVMAKYYRRASEAQRQRFSHVFRSSLIRTYAKALANFEIGRFETLEGAEGSRADKAEVQVNVYAADGTRYAVVYTLTNRDGSWKLINVVFDGINLGITFRNQFANMVEERGGDLDQVIDLWAQHMETVGEAG